MNLSKNFTLSELTRSDTAERLGIDNRPDQGEVENLRLLVQNILQPVRDHFGPVRVNSGFRCKTLNQAIGSKDTSQHILGQAADIECQGVSNYQLATWIQNNLEHDQVILECYKPGEPDSGWVHVSYSQLHNRNKSLTYDGKTYQEGLLA